MDRIDRFLNINRNRVLQTSDNIVGVGKALR